MRHLRIKIGWNEEERTSSRFVVPFLCLVAAAILLAGCSQLEKPAPKPYFAETAPPRKQEFRWSNGKMPLSFDPALASAPPETDIVRAMFEGLTETDPVTLDALPAVATAWKSSDDGRVWTFDLRRDARWSNGEVVSADDFVKSWVRLAEMGETAAHHELLDNIVGMTAIRGRIKNAAPDNNETAQGDRVARPHASSVDPLPQPPASVGSRPPEKDALSPAPQRTDPNLTASKAKVSAARDELGVEASEKFVLKVTLIKPDREFPILVSHPIFRPVHVPEKGFEDGGLNADIVTNGAFRVTSVGQDGVTLDRSESYWNKEKVLLERVRFVPAENAEKALEAYRAGEVDAVTNAEFEPLALKLLTPFDDFRRTVHSAVNLYHFNLSRKPYDDRRVREALAISIERERLTDDEMDGATKPAFSYSPFAAEGERGIRQDPERARQLLAEAGFAGGENFPKIRLLVKRNDVQQRIARSVSEMWRENLGIESDVAVMEPVDFEAARSSGDYDLVREGVVLSTRDETVNMMTIFSHDKAESVGEHSNGAPNETEPGPAVPDRENATRADAKKSVDGAEPARSANSPDGDLPTHAGPFESILTESQAIDELRAIPLYFPTTYSLVKPYVIGFSTNTLDAPWLQIVRIDSFWEPRRIGE